MKVAIVSDAIYPYNKGGKEKRIYEISTRLAKKGHQITVYTMKWWDGPDTIIDECVQIKAISPYFPLYSGKRRSIKEALLFSIYCFKLIREDFDFVEVDHMPYFLLFSTKIVSFIKRKKLLVIWNEVWGVSYWIKYLGPLGLLAALIERITSMLPNKFTAVSKHTARELTTKLKVSQKKITIVPNGISIAEIESVTPATIYSDVIFIGRLLSHKNINILVQSIAQLKTRFPLIKCIIVGKGPEKSNLIEMVQKNDLKENIEFMEDIEDHNELYALMKSSIIFAFPSTREGFGIAVLEANACGLPVITTDAPQNAAKDLIHEGLHGMIIPLSVKTLGDAIEKYLINNINTSNFMPALQQYDWDIIAQKVEDIYATIGLEKTKSRGKPPFDNLGGSRAVQKHEKILTISSKVGKEE
jgi:glycosyltransferase involved in cell wall biosynthesis